MKIILSDNFLGNVEVLEGQNIVCNKFDLTRFKSESVKDREEEAIAENKANSKPEWMKFAGIFENNADFEEIMNSIQAERDSDDDSEVDPSFYL